MFAYSCRIKICASGFYKLLESIFRLLLVVEAFSLHKVEMLEEVVLSWREVWWIWQMKKNFVAQFVQLLRCWLRSVQLGIVLEQNWAYSVDQCRLQALHFSVHLRCNHFTWIQKAVVHQTSRQPPWPFFVTGLALGSTLELLLSPTTELVITGCHIKFTFHLTLQPNQEMVHHCCCIE